MVDQQANEFIVLLLGKLLKQINAGVNLSNGRREWMDFRPRTSIYTYKYS